MLILLRFLICFRGYLTFPQKLPKIFEFCFYQNTSERLLYKMKKDILKISLKMKSREHGESMTRWLRTVIVQVWSTGVVPTDRRRGLVTPIYKGRGDRKDCNNYRGITLLSVPGKVFARLLLNRIRDHLILTQRPEQAGFTPKRSTIDRILGLRVLIERRLEYQRGFIAAYVDFKKAFDSVDRRTLWDLLRRRGIPAGILSLISALYSDTESAIKSGGCVSRFF